MRYHWKIEAKKFILDFKIPYYTIGSIRGKFLKIDGDVIANELFEDPSIHLHLPVNAINTMDEQWDAKLKSEDFLGSAAFPTIDFYSDNGCNLRSGIIQELTGKIRIKGKSSHVTITVIAATIKSTIKAPSAKFILKTSIQLADFGFSIDNDIIGNDVQLTIQISLLRSALADS